MRFFKRIFVLDRFLLAFFLSFLLTVLAMIWDSRTIDRTQTPRLFCLYAFLAVVLIFSLLPQVRRRLSWDGLRSPLIYSYAAYVISVWGSFFFAFNVSAGFMDAYLASASFFVLCAAVLFFKSTPAWHQILAKVSVFTAIVSGSVGQYQLFTQIGASWYSRDALTTLSGLMSNVNLYASFLMLLFPICILGVVILKGWWRALSLISLVNTAFLLLVLQSRAAWLGVCVAFLFTVAIACLRPRILGLSHKRVYYIAFFTALFACALAFLIFLGPSQNPFANRVWNIFSDDVRVADGGRLAVWKTTLRMIVDHFPFGVGAGNFPVRLYDYRGGGELDFLNGNLEWMEPHNDYLWVLSEKGFLGGLSFLAIFFFAARCCCRVLQRCIDPIHGWTAVLCFSSVLAYMVNSFFDFPLCRVNHQVCLSLFLAALVVLDRITLQRATPLWQEKPVYLKSCYLQFVGAGLVIFIASGLAYSIAAYTQERYVAMARKALEQENWDALAANSRLAATRWRTLDCYAVPICFLEGMAYMRKGENDAAIACFEKARLQIPNRFYIINNLGVLYLQRRDYERAIRFLGYAVEHFPHRFESLNNLASCYNQLGAYKKALSLLKKIPPEMATDEVRMNQDLAVRGIELQSSSLSKKTPVDPR